MRVSRGYRTVPEGSVRITSVALGDKDFGNPQGVFSISDTWSPDQPVEIRVAIWVDEAAIRSHLGLVEEDLIIGGVSSYCRATGLRHLGEATSLQENDSNLTVVLPAFEVNDFVIIEPTLAVRLKPLTKRGVGSPQLDFSRIWEDVFRLDLTGSLSRANVISENFDEMPGYEGALWRVVLDPPREIVDLLEADHSNVILVAINSARRGELTTTVARVALATDVAVAAIDSLFGAFPDATSRNAALEVLKNPGPDAGSWVRFLRGVLGVAIGNTFQDASAAWSSGREEARTRLQSHYAVNVYRGDDS